MSNQIDIALRIRDLRKMSNMSQNELADQLGLKWAAYQRLESKGGFSYENIKTAAEIFNVSEKYITDGIEQDISIMVADDTETGPNRLFDNTTIVQDKTRNECLKTELLDIFEKMSYEEQKTLVEFIKFQLDSD